MKEKSEQKGFKEQISDWKFNLFFSEVLFTELFHFWFHKLITECETTTVIITVYKDKRGLK